MEVQATSVFHKLHQSHKKIKILEGGARSSKTWSILLEIMLLCQAGKNLSFTITRMNLTWLKDTVLKDFDEMLRLYKWKITPSINPRRPDQIYTLMNNEIAFIGADDESKLFGRKQDYFWMNEAIEMQQEQFDQLEMRTTTGGFIDYNPRFEQHWIYKLEQRPDVELIKSTVIDNPFAPAEVRNKIIGYEPTAVNIEAGTSNAYMWDVYGLGKRTAREGLVYPDWKVFVTEPTGRIVYGLDFGFTNHPTALMRICLSENSIYATEKIYETNLTNVNIADRMNSLNISKSDIIIADCAEPKSIHELKSMGWNVQPAFKGADSVIHGIQLIYEKKLFVNANSLNLQRELNKYVFMDVRGEKTNQPRKEDDHCMDSMRYAVAYLCRKKKQFLFA